MIQRGKLIVIEGADASGKTSLCNDLLEAVQKDGINAELFQFPGSSEGTLGELVYRIHHNHKEEFNIPSLHPCSLQLMHIAAHVDSIESRIKKKINRGTWILLDRYWWSTYVYGLVAGVTVKSLKNMVSVEKEAWGDLKPDILFYIKTDIPLRDDDLNLVTWKKIKRSYALLLEKQKNYYHCVPIITQKGDASRHSSLKKMLSFLLNGEPKCKKETIIGNSYK